MNYKSALSNYAKKRIEEIREADIVVGIPCLNNEKTIQHVIQMGKKKLHTPEEVQFSSSF